MSNYPSKVLVFGEYTIINNSPALAIPYYNYYSQWSDASELPLSNSSISFEDSQKSLYKILHDLQQLDLAQLPIDNLNLEQFEADLKNDLWFCSNVPMGYGLGSSGAVCAGIYDRYVSNKSNDLTEQKNILSTLECSFHGKSSGIDPLIAYTNKALWVKADKSIEPIALSSPTKDKGAIFLIDTHQPRVSTPLINFFVEQSKQDSFVQQFIYPTSAAVAQAIHALYSLNDTVLLQATEQISRLQLKHLPPMIPTHLLPLWEQGLESQAFYMKICGAGGGGFMLGITEDWNAIQRYLTNYDTQVVLNF